MGRLRARLRLATIDGARPVRGGERGRMEKTLGGNGLKVGELAYFLAADYIKNISMYLLQPPISCLEGGAVGGEWSIGDNRRQEGEGILMRGERGEVL